MIRVATAEDVPAITALTLAAYAKWAPLIGREPLPMTVDYVSDSLSVPRQGAANCAAAADTAWPGENDSTGRGA